MPESSTLLVQLHGGDLDRQPPQVNTTACAASFLAVLRTSHRYPRRSSAALGPASAQCMYDAGEGLVVSRLLIDVGMRLLPMNDRADRACAVPKRRPRA